MKFKFKIAGWILGLGLGTMVDATADVTTWKACTTTGMPTMFTACTLASCADFDGYQCSVSPSGYVQTLNKPVDSGAGVAYAVVNSDTRTVSALIYTYTSCPSGYDKQSISLKSVAGTSLGCCAGIGTYNSHENTMIYTCVKKECAKGTYGDGITCSTCPSPGTSATDATAKNDCYVTNGTATRGAYTYTHNCYYKN